VRVVDKACARAGWQVERADEFAAFFVALMQLAPVFVRPPDDEDGAANGGDVSEVTADA
jgi:hypothetical protein